MRLRADLLRLMEVHARRPWKLLTLFAVLLVPAWAQSNDAQRLVREVVFNEVQAQTHPQPRWAYTLEKTNASGTKLTRIIETRDGLVGRLLEINGKPLDAITEANEMHRLNELKRDPRQMKQKLARQERDRDRVLKIVRALPTAFLYTQQSANDKETVLAFKPNPNFQPDSFETSILKAMSGTVRMSTSQKRLIELRGTLTSDVSIGLGIIGKAQKGGTLLLQQQEVAPASWEITVFSMKVVGRAVFKHVDMSVEESAKDFKAIQHPLSAPEAIDLLLKGRW
ncbi:MAG: hypothetical protein NVS9B15_01880 [Acidobacteriaceae bacterium]